jgi:hypothetical protein
MDHHYIDEHAVAERYLGNTLALEDREAFERHLVDCQECTDRLLLAGMFHARLGNGAGASHGTTHGTTHGATDGATDGATQGSPQGAGALTGPAALKRRAWNDPRALEDNVESGPPPALFVRVKPLQLLWILLISAFLLVAIPALVWGIFEGYSAR